MDIEVERFASDWLGVSMTFAPKEIDAMIERLKALKAGEIGHFHVRTNRFDGSPSIADIEFSLADSTGDCFSVE